jgi:tRNA nucleotidyltransferase (CCA-adding enzyme)
MEARPSRMLAVLRDCGALAELLPEVDALYGVPQPPGPHPEIDTGVHVALALDHAAGGGVALPARYAVLAHDLGKATSPRAAWPSHHGHERSGMRAAERISARLRVPLACRDAARLAARFHGVVHRAAELRPATLLDLLTAADALRRPERLETLLEACAADACSRPGAAPAFAPARLLREALAVVKAVDAGGVARAAAGRTKGTDGAGDRVAAAVRAARLAALREWKRAAAVGG